MIDYNVKITLYDLAHSKGVPLALTEVVLIMQAKLIALEAKLGAIEGVATRLALDLECMVLDPQSTCWHDKAHESLQQHRDLMDEWYQQDHVSPLGTE